MGVTESLTNVSCSGSFRRISAATGSGACIPWMSPGMLCDRLKSAAVFSAAVLAAVGDFTFTTGSSSYKQNPSLH